MPLCVTIHARRISGNRRFDSGQGRNRRAPEIAARAPKYTELTPRKDGGMRRYEPEREGRNVKSFWRNPCWFESSYRHQLSIGCGLVNSGKKRWNPLTARKDGRHAGKPLNQQHGLSTGAICRAALRREAHPGQSRSVAPEKRR